MSSMSADYNTLVNQAPMTAKLYFRKAVKEIDMEFGDGYAKEHTDLVIAFMQVSNDDYVNASTIKARDEIIESEMSEFRELVSRTIEQIYERVSDYLTFMEKPD